MRKMLVLVAVATLAITACGDDDADTSGSESTGEETGDDDVQMNEDGLITLPFAEWQAEVNDTCSTRISSFFSREPNTDLAIYLEGLFVGIVEMNDAIQLIPPPDDNLGLVEEWFEIHATQAAAIESGLPELREGRTNTELAAAALQDFQAVGPRNDELIEELGVTGCVPDDAARLDALAALTEAATAEG